RATEAALLGAHGGSLLAAVRGADGPLAAVVVCEDPADGTPFTAFDRECLGTLCAAAAAVRATAERFRLQQDRALALLGAPACRDPKRRAAAREARERLLVAARALGFVPAERALRALALDLGPWAWPAAGRESLAAVAEGDPTGRVPRLCRLLQDAEECAQGEFAGADLVVVLAAAGLRFQALRLAGRSSYEAWRSAVAWIGLTADPRFRDRFPEAVEPARRPARRARSLLAPPGLGPPNAT